MAKKIITHGHKYDSTKAVFQFTCRVCDCEWYDDKPKLMTKQQLREQDELVNELDDLRASECPECTNIYEPVYYATTTKISKELWSKM